jgi:hypothetical protein
MYWEEQEELTKRLMVEKMMAVQYRPQYASLRNAPMSEVRYDVPSQLL